MQEGDGETEAEPLPQFPRYPSVLPGRGTLGLAVPCGGQG